MKNCTISLIACILLILIPAVSPCQILVEGVVLGRGEKPVEGAAVRLTVRDGNGSSQTVLSTDSGKFIFKHIVPGKYFLLVSAIGYKKYVSADFAVKLGAGKQEPITVSLTDSIAMLTGVYVQARQKSLQVELDKKIYTVDKSAAVAGVSSADLIKNLPSVSLNQDGSIDFRGNNIIIWLDGRPIGASGIAAQAMLEQIPASSIKSIELITTPSARYDAAGNAGIINIITKRSNMAGLVASGNLSYGTGNKSEAGINISYRTKKVLLSGNYIYSDTRFLFDRRNEIGSYLADTSWFINQVFDGHSRRKLQSLRFTLDYYIGGLDQLSINWRSRKRATGNSTLLNIEYFDEIRQKDKSSVRNANESDKEKDADYSAKYEKRTVRKGEKLTAEISFNDNPQKENTFLNELFYLPGGDPLPGILQEKTFKSIRGRKTLFELGYTRPVNDSLKIETGIKYSHQVSGNQFATDSFNTALQEWVPNHSFTDVFSTAENILGVYINISGKNKQWAYQGGIRFENSVFRSGIKSGNFEKQYANFFPSAALQYSVTGDKQLQLSYSRRITRPVFTQLNPFVSYVDRLNIRVGNPFLLPEFTHSAELNYIVNHSNWLFTATAFYRSTGNIITSITTLDNDVRKQSWANLARSVNTGIEWSSTHPVIKDKWKISSSLSVYRSRIYGPVQSSSLSNTGYTYSIRCVSSVSMGNFGEFHQRFYYNSASIGIQGKVRAVYFLDLSVRIPVLNNKGALTFNWKDIFNSWETQLQLKDKTIAVESHSKRESRILYIGFSYTFSKVKQKEDKKNMQLERVEPAFNY